MNEYLTECHYISQWWQRWDQCKFEIIQFFCSVKPQKTFGEICYECIPCKPNVTTIYNGGRGGITASLKLSHIVMLKPQKTCSEIGYE